MFKGVFSAVGPKRPRSVSDSSDSSPKRAYSSDDLLEGSLGQSRGSNSFFDDKDLHELGTNILLPKHPTQPHNFNAGIHPQPSEPATVDSNKAWAEEWFGSKIIKGESQHPTEEAFIAPTFQGVRRSDSSLSLNQDLREETKAGDREDMKLEEGFPSSPTPTNPVVSTKSYIDSWPLSPKTTPTKPDRERAKHKEGSPARPILNNPPKPTKVDNWLPFPSPTPTKPTTDEWPLSYPTDNADQEMKASPKLAPPTNLTFTQSDSSAALSENELNEEGTSLDVDPSTVKSDLQENTAPKMHFKGFINGVATWRIESTSPGNDSSPQNKNNPFPQEKSVKKMSSTTSFLRKIAVLSKPENDSHPPPTPSASRPLTNAAKGVPFDPSNPRGQESDHPSPRHGQAHEETESNRPRRRQNNPFATLQPIVESTTFTPKPADSPTPFGSSLYGVDSTFAKRMEEAGRLRRLQSQSHVDLKVDNKADNKADNTPTPVTKSQKHARSSSERTPSSSGFLNTPLEDLSNTWRQETRHIVVPPATPPKPPPKVSPAVSRSEQDSPRTPNSHAAELQALRDQLAHAMRDKQMFEQELARVMTQSASDRERLVRELRTLKQENSVLVGQADRLTRHNDDTSSELTLAQAELRKLKAEKRGWQEQLDTMHHKVVRAERQIRCLDHLTRAKLEGREEAVYGAPKRTKLALTQIRSSEEVINAITDLNEEILQAANLLIENLDRTRFYGPITESSNKAEKVVGTHVTEMLKAQSGSSTSGFRQLLMLVVMEVFLVHWCSAIIEGFYPKRPSFADLLVELSSHTTTTTASKLLTPF